MSKHVQNYEVADFFDQVPSTDPLVTNGKNQYRAKPDIVNISTFDDGVKGGHFIERADGTGWIIGPRLITSGGLRGSGGLTVDASTPDGTVVWLSPPVNIRNGYTNSGVDLKFEASYGVAALGTGGVDFIPQYSSDGGATWKNFITGGTDGVVPSPIGGETRGVTDFQHVSVTPGVHTFQLRTVTSNNSLAGGGEIQVAGLQSGYATTLFCSTEAV